MDAPERWVNKQFAWIFPAPLRSCVALFLFLFQGCAHERIERAGGHVADLLSELNGAKVDAVSLPGLPTVYFRNGDDPCLVAHEETHRAQVARDGHWAWKRRYLAEWVLRGYEGISYEVEAREVQAACEAAR
jgi:hypothetical protein